MVYTDKTLVKQLMQVIFFFFLYRRHDWSLDFHGNLDKINTMSVQFLHTEKFHKASNALMALVYKNQSVFFFLGVHRGVFMVRLQRPLTLFRINRQEYM